MSIPSRFNRPDRNLSVIFHHGRRRGAVAEPDVPGFARVPEQLWKCGPCETVRQWGHLEPETWVPRLAYLLCEGDCEGHTRHVYVGVAE